MLSVINGLNEKQEISPTLDTLVSQQFEKVA